MKKVMFVFIIVGLLSVKGVNAGEGGGGDSGGDDGTDGFVQVCIKPIHVKSRQPVDTSSDNGGDSNSGDSTGDGCTSDGDGGEF